MFPKILFQPADFPRNAHPPPRPLGWQHWSPAVASKDGTADVAWDPRHPFRSEKPWKKWWVYRAKDGDFMWFTSWFNHGLATKLRFRTELTRKIWENIIVGFSEWKQIVNMDQSKLWSLGSPSHIIWSSWCNEKQTKPYKTNEFSTYFPYTHCLFWTGKNVDLV